MKEYWVEVDNQNRLILPPEVINHYGIRPGVQIQLKEDSESLSLQRPITHLAKVYIEPTNRCNLSCQTCIRNNWEEIQSDITSETFARIINSISNLPSRPDVFFGGFGEPLLIADIAEMVAEAKKVAGKVELITNGMLLTEDRSRDLIQAGLDVLWISLDGASPEQFSKVRIGGTLPAVLDNIRTFKHLRKKHSYHPEIGISFVAMRKNIADLPALIHMSKNLGASHYMVTNVLPYSEEMCKEILYTQSIDRVDSNPSHWEPRIDLPRMDMNSLSQEALFQTIHYRNNIHINHVALGQDRGHCPFIERGSISIRWDGAVSPCLPLMHQYISYLHERPRTVKPFLVGDLSSQDIQSIWESPNYLAFRKLVTAFDFSPCISCGGCSWSETNEEDCFTNTFPTCGGCLWAQGVIQCP